VEGAAQARSRQAPPQPPPAAAACSHRAAGAGRPAASRVTQPHPAPGGRRRHDPVLFVAWEVAPTTSPTPTTPMSAPTSSAWRRK
jgi:hypothetical protein